MKKNKPILVLVIVIFFSGFLSNCVHKSKCRDYKYSLVSKKSKIKLRKFLRDCNQPEHYNYKNALIRIEDLRNPPTEPEEYPVEPEAYEPKPEAPESLFSVVWYGIDFYNKKELSELIKNNAIHEDYYVGIAVKTIILSYQILE